MYLDVISRDVVQHLFYGNKANRTYLTMKLVVRQIFSYF